MQLSYNNINLNLKKFVWYEAIDYLKLSYPVYVCENDIINCSYILQVIMDNGYSYENSINVIKIILSELKTNSRFSHFYFQDRCYFSLNINT